MFRNILQKKIDLRFTSTDYGVKLKLQENYNNVSIEGN